MGDNINGAREAAKARREQLRSDTACKPSQEIFEAVSRANATQHVAVGSELGMDIAGLTVVKVIEGHGRVTAIQLSDGSVIGPATYHFAEYVQRFLVRVGG